MQHKNTAYSLRNLQENHFSSIVQDFWASLCYPAIDIFGCRWAPVLDIRLRYRYSYSLSPYVFQVSLVSLALYPPNSVQNQPKRGSHGEVKGGGASQLKLSLEANAPKGPIAAVASPIAEKSTFLAIFWGFLIFSGSPVL